MGNDLGTSLELGALDMEIKVAVKSRSLQKIVNCK